MSDDQSNLIPSPRNAIVPYSPVTDASRPDRPDSPHHTEDTPCTCHRVCYHYSTVVWLFPPHEHRYSSCYTTPLAFYSSSSTPSIPEPRPTSQYHSSCFYHQPGQPAGEVLIYPSLIRRFSGIKWNISTPPYTAAFREAPNPHESAFQPPLSYCEIISSFLPWTIKVKAHDLCPYITILSLLESIYATLGEPIDIYVYDGIPLYFKDDIDATYESRCLSIPDLKACRRAKDAGVRRVDYLLDKSIFEGLQQDNDLPDTFELKLESIWL